MLVNFLSAVNHTGNEDKYTAINVLFLALFKDWENYFNINKWLWAVQIIINFKFALLCQLVARVIGRDRGYFPFIFLSVLSKITWTLSAVHNNGISFWDSWIENEFLEEQRKRSENLNTKIKKHRKNVQLWNGKFETVLFSNIRWRSKII